MIIFYSGGSYGPDEFFSREEMSKSTVGVMLTYYEVYKERRRTIRRLQKYQKWKRGSGVESGQKESG